MAAAELIIVVAPAPFKVIRLFTVTFSLNVPADTNKVAPAVATVAALLIFVNIARSYH